MSKAMTAIASIGMLVLCSGLAGTAAAADSPPAAVPESLSPDWIGEGLQAGARLGWHAETAGDLNGDGFDDLVGGAPRAGGSQVAGAAYLYYGGASTLPSAPDWIFACQDYGANCGFAVASAGDVNGDGYDDLLVGANYQAAYQDTGIPQRGRVYLFYGDAAGPSNVPSWQASTDPAGALFGSGVSGAGDLNGDGYADFVATSPEYDHGQTDEGRVSLWYGSASGPAAAPDWAFETDLDFALLTQATGAGDVNGDGYDDLLVGGRYQAGGYVRLFLGGAIGLGSQPAWSASGQSGSQFGFMINSAGDVNADGYDDVIIVADLHDDPETNEGAAFLWLGGPDGMIGQGIAGTPANADWSWGGDQSASFLRWADGVGDFTGDGHDDVVLGHSLWTGGQSNEGRILVFAGSPAGLGTEPAFVGESDRPGARLGWAAEGAGDVNGDGVQDIIAGAERYTNGESEEGALYLYSGQPAECVDEDGDGYGFPASASCPAGAVPDCDDSDPNVNPGHEEFCDCKDNNCNGTRDEIPECRALDGDGDELVCPGDDNCPDVYNPGQEDSDGDGVGDACDNCRQFPNPDQANADGDELGDVCDSCPMAADLGLDTDQDGHGDACDNCPTVPNPSQSDFDEDRKGDACDLCLEIPDLQDGDGDGFGDVCDNCPSSANPSQADVDFDTIGDACDNCPAASNTDQEDLDGDGVGNACDNCPNIPNPTQEPIVCDPMGDFSIDFKSPAGRGSGLITWNTNSEIDLVGFNLLNIASDGTRTPINATLIPCQACGDGRGATYAYILSKHKSGRDIFLEWVRDGGQRTIVGPARRD